jgi:hypothetical protein
VGAEILVSLKTSEEKMVKILHHFLVPWDGCSYQEWGK